MTIPLEDAELLLINIERGIKDLKIKYESKQSERLLSNHILMNDFINNNVKTHIKPLKDLLLKIRENHVGDFKSSTNFDVAVKYCNEIEKVLNSIMVMYRMRDNLVDIKLKWQYNLPKMMDDLVHLKNRFGIIKGQLTKKAFEYEEESWF